MISRRDSSSSGTRVVEILAAAIPIDETFDGAPAFPGAAPHPVRSGKTCWGDWRRTHAQTTVLDTRTGHRRSYSRSPYGDHGVSGRQSPATLDKRCHPRLPTIRLCFCEGAERAYPVVKGDGRWSSRRVQRLQRPVGYDPNAKVYEVAVRRPGGSEGF